MNSKLMDQNKLQLELSEKLNNRLQKLSDKVHNCSNLSTTLLSSYIEITCPNGSATAVQLHMLCIQHRRAFGVIIYTCMAVDIICLSFTYKKHNP